MAVLTLLLEACGLLGFTWALLARYRDPHVSPLALACVFLSWTLGFLGLLLLPIDIARHSKSQSHDEDGEDDGEETTATDLSGFVATWQALYWATFALSWLVLPLLVEWSQNGEFRAERRLLASLKRLMLHWTIVLAVAAAVVVYLLLVGHFTGRGLLGLAMASANTYGLVWLIVLLGYGLVDIPRSLWTLRHADARLRAVYFRATQVHHERMEAIFLFQDALRDAHGCYDRVLQAEGASIILTSDMQEVKAGLKTVLALVEADDKDAETAGRSSAQTTTAKASASAAKMRAGASPMLSTSGIATPPPSYSDVVELHRRVKAAQADLRGTEQAWLELCLRCEALQAQVGPTAGSSALPPVGLYSTANLLGQMRTLASATRVQLARLLLPPLWALGAVTAALGSLCILWGELTMSWRSAQLSLFRVLSLTTPSTVEMLAFALLLYMVLCAYASLFKLRSFGRWALRGHHNSSELALLRTSIQQCRLQFALGYNFLLLIHEPRLMDATAFHRLWSHMQVVRVLGRDFSVYAPVLMVALVACTAANAYARLLHGLVGMEQYEQLLPGNADHEAQIGKGEQLLRKGVDKLRRATKQAAAARPMTTTTWRGRGFQAPPEMAASLLDSHERDDDGLP